MLRITSGKTSHGTCVKNYVFLCMLRTVFGNIAFIRKFINCIVRRLCRRFIDTMASGEIDTDSMKVLEKVEGFEERRNTLLLGPRKFPVGGPNLPAETVVFFPGDVQVLCARGAFVAPWAGAALAISFFRKSKSTRVESKASFHKTVILLMIFSPTL